MINTILVPQGAEYQAVCRGLKNVAPQPNVLPIPIGITPVTDYLQQWQKAQSLPQTALVVGLCGSLSPDYQVGDIVLYEECLNLNGERKKCDPPVTSQLQQNLSQEIPLVKSLTSDRPISLAQEKQQLALSSQADVVDMEGLAILTNLTAKIAMLRVISDNCTQDLPDLSKAISSEGALLPLPLTLAMLRQPLAAMRLIDGSLKSLRVLEEVIASLHL